MTIATSLTDQIIQLVDQLTVDQKQKVLDYARGLGRPRGTPGHVLVALMDKIQIDPADLDEMEKAIEEECERIDVDGWDISL